MEVERPALGIGGLFLLGRRRLDLLRCGEDVPCHVTLVEEFRLLELVEDRRNPSGCIEFWCLRVHGLPSAMPRQNRDLQPRRSSRWVEVSLLPFCYLAPELAACRAARLSFAAGLAGWLSFAACVMTAWSVMNCRYRSCSLSMCGWP